MALPSTSLVWNWPPLGKYLKRSPSAHAYQSHSLSCPCHGCPCHKARPVVSPFPPAPASSLCGLFLWFPPCPYRAPQGVLLKGQFSYSRKAQRQLPNSMWIQRHIFSFCIFLSLVVVLSHLHVPWRGSSDPSKPSGPSRLWKYCIRLQTHARETIW